MPTEIIYPVEVYANVQGSQIPDPLYIGTIVVDSLSAYTISASPDMYALALTAGNLFVLSSASLAISSGRVAIGSVSGIEMLSITGKSGTGILGLSSCSLTSGIRITNSSISSTWNIAVVGSTTGSRFGAPGSLIIYNQNFNAITGSLSASKSGQFSSFFMMTTGGKCSIGSTGDVRTFDIFSSDTGEQQTFYVLKSISADYVLGGLTGVLIKIDVAGTGTMSGGVVGVVVSTNYGKTKPLTADLISNYSILTLTGTTSSMTSMMTNVSEMRFNDPASGCVLSAYNYLSRASNSASSVSICNAYGFFHKKWPIALIPFGSTAYSFYAEGDPAYFADRVLIGTTSASATLHVQGSISATSITTNSITSISGQFNNLVTNTITFISATSVDIITTGGLSAYSISAVNAKFNSLTSNSLSSNSLTTDIGNIITLNSTNSSLANITTTAVTGNSASFTNLTGSNFVSQISNVANITVTSITGSSAKFGSITANSISASAFTGLSASFNSLTTTQGNVILAQNTGSVGVGIIPIAKLHVASSNIPFIATGGTITTSGDYTYHTFTSNGTFTPTNTQGTVEFLIVGGGGGGGNGEIDALGDGAGGGGGGGFVESTYSVSVSAYPIIVGNGGSGSTSIAQKGGSGVDSSFHSFIAIGGGGGGSDNNDATGINQGADGGCGGGGASMVTTITFGGTGSQGYNGGTTNASGASQGGAGGGGQSASGASVTSNNGSNGGAGRISTIDNGIYGGGGGGGAGRAGAGYSGGAGGIGGGGKGAGGGIQTVGVANTGGGGGGGGGALANSDGRAGGSGIVIIRYLTSGGGSLQFIVGFDSLNYNSFLINSSGNLTVAGVGTNPSITLTPGGTGNVILNGNIGINSTNPTHRLFVNDTISAFNMSAMSASINSLSAVTISANNIRTSALTSLSAQINGLTSNSLKTTSLTSFSVCSASGAFQHINNISQFSQSICSTSGSHEAINTRSINTFTLCAITGWMQSVFVRNINQINNVNYSWPANQGAVNTYLKNNSIGGLSWGDPLSAGQTYTIGVTGSLNNTKIHLIFTNGLLSATAAG